MSTTLRLAIVSGAWDRKKIDALLMCARVARLEPTIYLAPPAFDAFLRMMYDSTKGTGMEVTIPFEDWKRNCEAVGTRFTYSGVEVCLDDPERHKCI